jgi:drug/metabolite transporter (DMT)-like permease
LGDWATLLALVLIWGTAFLFTRIAVERVPPATLVAGRIGIAALVLTAVVYGVGLRLPPPGRIWGRFLVLALVGNSLPFFLISWGQERIDSGLAGILMAVMPLATLVLAHFLVVGERMNRRTAAGFVLGFLGVVVLMGPEAIAELGEGGSELAREAAVLSGALCYAVNTILARRLPETPPLVSSASVMILASLVMVPVALALDRPLDLPPDPVSVAAVVWLGLAATAAATILYFQLIASAGPTFFSLINYQIPLVAVLAGVLVLGEEPGWTALGSLVLILAGLALSQLGPREGTASQP